MKQVVVQHRIKPDRADENQRLVEKVSEELADRDPGGLRYATFRMADGVSFIHVAVINDPNANPLGETAAFAEFQGELSTAATSPRPRATQRLSAPTASSRTDGGTWK